MDRKIAFILLPVIALGVIAWLFPDAPVRKAVERAATVVTSWRPSGASSSTPDTHVENPQFVPPASATVGPEFAQLPEIRIWAISKGTTYGWVQLPRGTVVDLVRNEGDFVLVRFEDTYLRIHKTVVEAGVVVPKVRKPRIYAAAE